jgi:uncharacterized protein
MKPRIIGFDLARAYAIPGMFIVNFVNVFGGYEDKSIVGKFASLFNGNASTLFVMLAGMGLALMTNKPIYSQDEKNKIKSLVLKRSWFLFALGLLLYTWWPFDILHFYGGYMHIAALILFVPKQWYLWGAALVIVIYHVLFAIIPYETGWDFVTFTYVDFWTMEGFLRNSLYNGSNPLFPWLAFFLFGMWLGKLDWLDKTLLAKIFWRALTIFIIVESLQYAASFQIFSKDITEYILADYFPPFLPFMLSTASAGVLTICLFTYVGERYKNARFIEVLAKTGQMTLSNYILHLTLGMVVLAFFLGKSYSPELSKQIPTPALYTMTFAIVFYFLSLLFTVWWSKRFIHGPLELLMRKITD